MRRGNAVDAVHPLRPDNEEILPAIVVVVHEPHTPARVLQRNSSQPSLILEEYSKSPVSPIREESVPLIG
jgi:hypothetical protein